MNHPPVSVVLALFAAALFAAVEVSATPAAPDPTPSAPTLEDTSWLLAAYRVGDALVEVTAGAPPARFRLAGGRIAGSPGCNRLGGGYTLDGGRLSFDANLASTMMACPEPLMQQEQAVSAALVKVAAYRLDGELLEFTDASGQPLLRFVRLKPTPLVGQVWHLQGYNNGKQAMVSALDGTEITLEFRDDGTLGGSDGCNRYMSGYTLQGETLTIGPVATTRMACKGPQGAAEQARAYAAALGTVRGYRIDGGELTLLSGEGTAAIRLSAAAPPPVVVPTPAQSSEPTVQSTPEQP